MSDLANTVLAVSGSGAGDSDSFSVALARQSHEVAVEQPAPGEREDLAILVARACQRAGTSLQQVREVRVDVGPGSYIGLRVAVTFARFVAAFGPARLLTSSSLQMLAMAVITADPGLHGRRLRPLIDGRQGRLHTASYRAADLLVREQPPTTIPASDLAATLGDDDVVIAAPALLERLDRRPRVDFRPPAETTARTLLLGGQQLDETEVEAVQPLYLMGSYVD